MGNLRQGFFVLILPIITFSLIGSAGAGPLDGKKAVVLEQASDISNLPVDKEDINAPDKKASAQVKTVVFKVDTAACSIYSAPDGYEYIDVNGLAPAAKAGEP